MFDAYLRVRKAARDRDYGKIVAPARFLTARSAPLSNIFLRDNCRQRFRAARSDPADTGGLCSGTCIARAGSGGRAERNNEREREREGDKGRNEARGKDAPHVCR